MSQSELPLFQARANDPNVANFVCLLHSNGNWMTAADGLQALGMPNTESNRRLVRAWAEAAEDEVISGQAGYRHVEKATADEINHSCNAWESQAKKMIARAIKTRRHAHQAVG